MARTGLNMENPIHSNGGGVQLPSPYYKDEYATLYVGDCRDILKSLDVSNGFCFADPPYNVGKDYGVWNDSLTEQEYLSFCNEWITSVKRLCPTICIYPPTKYIREYWNMLGPGFKQVILTWTAEGAIRGGFVNQFACLLTNSKPVMRTKDHWPGLQVPGLGYFFTEEKYGHPGYTSEEVTRRVIHHLAPEGAMIVDPFCGTGTTLRCAKNARRPAIGIELNPEYAKTTVSRLAQEVFKI